MTLQRVATPGLRTASLHTNDATKALQKMSSFVFRSFAKFKNSKHGQLQIFWMYCIENIALKLFQKFHEILVQIPILIEYTIMIMECSCNIPFELSWMN